MPVAPKPVDVPTRFRAALAARPDVFAHEIIGLAVSGGGDSLAMMHLAARFLPAARLRVVTIDHGLRAGAADEIAEVAKQAKRLGLSHTVLNWSWDKTGNLQAAARAGRWRAIERWADTEIIDTILLGHTEDDQVETLLLRLARGSGIDGLSVMSRFDTRDGLRVVRPLLDVGRDELRHWLRNAGIKWCDDPSNDDPRFDRVRARQMYAHLENLGLTRKRLLQTIDHMQAAHRSLQIAAQSFARAHVRQDAGDLIFAPEALDLSKEDAPRRVIAAAFSWISGKPYRPRFERMLDVVSQAAHGQVATLGGCILTPLKGDMMRMTREASATRPYLRPPEIDVEATGFIWDRRWFIEGPLTPELQVKALGEGVRQCPDWRATAIPRLSLLASPSIWDGDRLISAPLAGFAEGWTAQIVADFHSSAFAH